MSASEGTQVFLYTSRGNIPLHFAVHAWFVVIRNGVKTRWEVLHQKHKSPASWGYLHKDALPFSDGMQILPLLPFRWQSRLIGQVSGAPAEEVVRILESSPESYPYTNHYRLTGPNSNSFAAWILTQVPSCNMTLPENAYGKDFKFPK